MHDTLRPIIHTFSDLNTSSLALAENIYSLIHQSLLHQDKFSLALSGGNTPRTLYRILGVQYKEKIQWNKIHFFWGDERYVPHNHPDSNYKLAYVVFLSKINIPDSNIHPIPTNLDSPEICAENYEKTLREYFLSNKRNSNDTFNLVLLGMGDDGHTASLFPNDPVLNEKEKWVQAVKAPDYMRPTDRVTLTLPILNLSKKIIFLVSGEKKKEVFNEIIHNPEMAKLKYPAARIQSQYPVEWYIDQSVQ